VLVYHAPLGGHSSCCVTSDHQAIAHTRVDVTSDGKRRSVIVGDVTQPVEPPNQARKRISWANGIQPQVRGLVCAWHLHGLMPPPWHTRSLWRGQARDWIGLDWMQFLQFTSQHPQAAQTRDQSEWAARHSVVEAANQNVPPDTADAGEVSAQVDDTDTQGMGGEAWVNRHVCHSYW
jgi:hypothetical protein